MDIPPVQYARAGDGTRIAWTRLPGESPPWLHVYTVGAPSMAMTLSMPSRRGFIEGLSGSQATVLFDWRGSGLSGPINGPLTLEDLTDDIAAVCDAVDEPLDAMLMNTGIFPAVLHAAACGHWRRLLLVAPSLYPSGHSPPLRGGSSRRIATVVTRCFGRPSCAARWT